MEAPPRVSDHDLADLKFSPTAALFEGKARAGIDISIFVVRTPPGRAVELHVHPYPETFVLLEGHGRWTAGDDIVELRPEATFRSSSSASTTPRPTIPSHRAPGRRSPSDRGRCGLPVGRVAGHHLALLVAHIEGRSSGGAA